MKEDIKTYNPEGSELRKLQLKMLDILIVVTDIANKHSIPYWLSGGTLLGAVRHGGFIPWDDDIDIELLYPDYKRLLKVLNTELPKDLYLQTPQDKGYRLLFTKIRDKNSRVFEEEDKIDRFKEKGIYIDIFPEERSYKFLKNIVDFFYGRGYRRVKRGQPFRSFSYFYEYTLSLFVLYPLGHILKHVARSICRLMRPSTVLHSYGIGNSSVHEIDTLFPLHTIQFENHTFSCPNNPDTYLTKQYGNYMKIPDVENRATHFLKAEYIK